MKNTILTIAIATLFQTIASAQLTKVAGPSASSESHFYYVHESDPPVITENHLIYSEDLNALVLRDPSQAHSTTLVIKSLPPFSSSSVPINIVLPKGKYTLSKCPDLVLPGDYHIYIEDVDEEKHYNLHLSEGHSLKATHEEVPGRFILHITQPGVKNSFK